VDTGGLDAAPAAAVTQAAERAARSTLALIESRHLLTRPHDQLRR
jgi:hypothetical protein